MKVCFIGMCGHSIKAHTVLKKRSDVQLCGVAPSSTHEKMYCSFDPEIPFYTSYSEMIDEIKPDLAIVSPVFGLTGTIITECSNRGIDVFAEKPVASSVDELKRVKKAVVDSGIRFSAMHYLRYDSAFYHAAKLVRNGMIGDIQLITSQKSYKYGVRPDWYNNRALYVGIIPWVGIHAIDWVYAFSRKRFLTVKSECSGNPELTALCQFTMEDGVLASINLDYYRPSSAPTHGDDRIRCVGTRGIIEVRDGQIILINSKGMHTINPPPAPELLSEFLDRKSTLSADEIFYLTYIALSARDSADRGELIHLEENI